MAYKAIIFDLFRTVILLSPEAPTMRVTEPSWRPAMAALRGPVEQALPGVPFDRFLDALVAATAEIVRERPPEYYEVPLRERYRRALVRLGRDGSGAEAISEHLSLLQMQQLVMHSALPPAHLTLLHTLAPRYRLGVLSNFDHAPTVRRILSRHGISNLFTVTLISDEFGRRKPHPSIFREALRRLDTAAGDTLYIGDSFVEDVQGAAAVGMDSAWINHAAAVAPAPGPQPRYVFTTVTDVGTVLAPGQPA